MFSHARHKQRFITLHRYLGLTTALFLMMAGLTGSLLAYYHELDEWLNPQLLFTKQQGSDFLPPFRLYQIAREYSKQYQGDISTLPLNLRPGRSLRFYVNGSESFNRLFLNPYNGAIMGSRNWGNLSDGIGNLPGFIYRLHYTLWLPDSWGIWLLGMIALLWTIDCFVALATTFPITQRFSWQLFFKRWRRSFTMHWKSSGYTFHVLLHRAAGLWLWGLLLIFAWSSVAFNLKDVYQPVTYALFGQPPRPPNTGHQQQPMGFEQALVIARQQAYISSQDEGHRIGHERSLRYIRHSNSYQYRFNSSRDVDESLARSVLYIDASSGELLASFWPTGQYSSITITQWLYALHMAEVFSWPYQLLVCLLGLMVTYFSYSGVLIWWKKRCKNQRRRLPHRS